MVDFGYDVADYCGVDPLFGTLADFDDLVTAAHERGLKVIVDFVPNHSSDQHPWFVESRSSRDNPKRDWYVWRDGKAPGEPPNNWLANFGGPSWTYDEHTGQWYLHIFLPEQPDLNWRSPALRAAMWDVVRFWVQRGVDGFRVDVAMGVGKDPELRDNPPNPHGSLAHKALGAFDSQLHVHDMFHPFLHEVYREFRQILDTWPDGRDRVIIGETHVFHPDWWASFFGAGDEMHLPFNFGLLKVPWEARAVAEHVAGIDAAATEAPGGWPTYVLSNHDEDRVAQRVGQAQARVALLLLLTLRGTPTLYYGEELGHPDVDIPPELEQDPWGKRVPGLGLSRDPSRTPMPWDPSRNGGFTSPDVTPWLPLVDDRARFSVAAQDADPGSMLHLTRAVLALRRTEPALTAGAFEIAHVDDAVLAYRRETPDDALLVVLNLTGEPATVAVGTGTATVLLSTSGDRTATVDLARLPLAPDEGLVLRP